MSIQYYHQRARFEKEGTYASNLGDVKELRTAVEEFVKGNSLPVVFSIGKSKVHPNDRFCKKIGRELAIQRMSRQTAKVHHVFIREQDMKVYLVTEGYGVILSISKSKDNPIVRGVFEKGSDYFGAMFC